jgi:hypothetical protein
MLDFNVTEQENSIEELFAKEFEKTKRHPMDKETSEIFLSLVLSQIGTFDIPENEKPFLYALMEKRISVLHDYKLDDRVLIFLSWICKSAGIGVMYCWYLQYESKKRNMKDISFDNFVEIFPMGFPSEDDLHRLWDSQKVLSKGMGSDNLLDYPQAGKSMY